MCCLLCAVCALLFAVCRSPFTFRLVCRLCRMVQPGVTAAHMKSLRNCKGQRWHYWMFVDRLSSPKPSFVNSLKFCRADLILRSERWGQHNHSCLETCRCMPAVELSDGFAGPACQSLITRRCVPIALLHRMLRRSVKGPA